MSRGPASASSDPELERLIRRSGDLPPELKRHWLRVLPHLQSADRQRLRDILGSGSQEPTARPAPSAVEGGGPSAADVRSLGLMHRQRLS